MKEPVEKLWVGADFFAHGSRWCLIFINGSKKECLAVMIKYDEPHVTGNIICSFRFGELVEYYPRYSQSHGDKK